MDTKTGIVCVCEEIKHLLIKKNKSYGDSAMHPINIFSNCTAQEQMNVRIDDKLNRIKRGQEFKGDDTELDLIGYLILKRVERMINNGTEECKVENTSTERLSHNSRQDRERDKLLDHGCDCADCAQQEKRLSELGSIRWTTVVPGTEEGIPTKRSSILR